MMPFTRLLILLALVSTRPAAAADARKAFADANHLYFEGHYDEAAKGYAALVETGIADPALLHNLGNAHFRSGRYGASILAYKRALALSPDAAFVDTLERNIDAARRTLQARYRASSDTALTYANPASALYQVTHSIDEQVNAIVFVGAWTLLFTALILRRMRSSRWPGRAAIALGLVALVSGLMLGGRVLTDGEGHIGIVVTADAKIRDGRHAVAQGRDLPEGLEVRIVDGDTEGWTQVELASGKRGWVASKDVSPI